MFDQNTPANLRRHLPGHHVTTARQAGWEEVENGELLTLAQNAGFEVFLTCDQNLTYQQNLEGRKITIVELSRNNWPLIRPHLEQIAAAVNFCVPGSYLRVVCA